MDIQIVAGQALSAAQFSAWRSLMRAEPGLRYPLLDPAFFSAVAQVRDDVYAAVLHDCGTPLGFFPYQLSATGSGRFAGGALADHQAMIVPPDVPVDIRELMRICGIRIFAFDRLIASQRTFASYHTTLNEAPSVDLRRDPGQRSIQERTVWSRVDAAETRLADRFGKLELVQIRDGAELFATLEQWRGQSHGRRRRVSVLANDWAAKVVTSLMSRVDGDFSVRAWALRGRRGPLAVRLGMCAWDTHHDWFAAGDPTLAADAPALVLLGKLIESSRREGWQRLTFGRFASPAARQMATRAVTLAEGFAEYPQRGRGAAAKDAPVACEVPASRSWIRRWTSVVTLPGKLVRAQRPGDELNR